MRKRTSKQDAPRVDRRVLRGGSLHFYPDIQKDSLLRRVLDTLVRFGRMLGAGAVWLWRRGREIWIRIPAATWYYRGQLWARRWTRRIHRRLTGAPLDVAGSGVPGPAAENTGAAAQPDAGNVPVYTVRPLTIREKWQRRRNRGRRTEATAMDRVRLALDGHASRARHGRSLSPKARVALVIATFSLLVMGGAGATALYISMQCHVSVVDRGVQTVYTSMEGTVGAFLEEQGIHVGQADAVEPVKEAPLEDGMRITVYRALPVYIDAAHDAQLVFMQRGTVEDALSMAGIVYDDMDIIEPALDTRIYANMRIRWSDIEKLTSVRKDSVDYNTIWRESDDLLLGTEKTTQEGRDGLVESETITVYQDGEEIYREVVRETVLVEMQPEIIDVGTKVTPSPTPSPTPSASRPTVSATQPPQTSGTEATPKPSSTKKPSATKRPSATKKPSATPKPSATQKPQATPKPDSSDTKVPGAPSSFVSTMVIEQVTAYTHTGNQVAMGGMPQYTRTYEKPGSVAVDPSVIPYGTLLYIPGYGYGLAEDAGPTDSHIDLFMNTRDECIQWGRKRNMEIYIVETKYKR